jgi:hypothetical protein
MKGVNDPWPITHHQIIQIIKTQTGYFGLFSDWVLFGAWNSVIGI